MEGGGRGRQVGGEGELTGMMVNEQEEEEEEEEAMTGDAAIDQPLLPPPSGRYSNIIHVARTSQVLAVT